MAGEKSRFHLHYGDLTDSASIQSIIQSVEPDEVYHLGAQTHVRVSFDVPVFTCDVTGLSNTRLLEAIRRSGLKTRFFQASTSEMFGTSPPPQNEQTRFAPCSPYAIAKLFAYWTTVNYRNAYGIFASNGILFNHESPRRGDWFVTRKITKCLALMLKGRMDKIFLGNLDATRDWGFAPEYVQAMHLILQQDEPGEFVIGTVEEHSVREFLEESFAYAGVEIEWQGEGLAEKGVVRSIDPVLNAPLKAGDVIIEIDPCFFRPTEVERLLADAAKARNELGWTPKIAFSELVRIMVDHDFKALDLPRKDEGVAMMRDKGFPLDQSRILRPLPRVGPLLTDFSAPVRIHSGSIAPFRGQP